MIEEQMILDPVKEFKIKKNSLEKEKIERYKDVVVNDFKFLKENKKKCKDSDFLKEYKKRTQETFSDLVNFLELSGAEMVSDINEIYNYYINGSRELAVRKDDPEKIVNLVNGDNIKLNFDPKVVGERGDKYANCAIWPHGPAGTSGIANAFIEGFTSAGPISTVIGVDYKKSDKLTLEDAKDKMMHLGDLNRVSVRILSGEIGLKDLEFIIVRIPRTYFAEEMMTEKEKKEDKAENKFFYIMRAFVFSDRFKNILKNKN